MQRPIDILTTYFGYQSFRHPQADIIDYVLSGKDALVLMPTGGGKSLCYQVPAMLLPGVTLVVSPLISLMKDQVDALCASGVPAAYLNSTLTADEVDRIESRAIRGELKILYMAPERLATPRAVAFLHQAKVSLIAVDEAHCISEWGHDFRPDYRNLQTLRNQFPEAPVLALTATATENVRADIARQLRLAGGVFVSGFDRPNLTYVVRPKQKAFAGLVGLLRNYKNESVIIYCFSRKGTEELAANLQKEGFIARAYHAGLDPKERSEVQERFIRDDIHVVTATIAFGMGIDKPDVRLVVHYDLPKSVEGYYQETGRAGRDGLPSQCVLFYTYADTRKHRYFIDQIEDDEERARAVMTLDRVVRYCQAGACRHKQLLAHFGERYEKASCEACDVCVPALRVAPVAAKTSYLKTASGPEDPALFERLRKLRKALADERDVPAFVIFGDKSLKDMAAKKPQDKAAFSRIFGVGAAKLEAFSDDFIAAIKEHAGV